jgi:quinol monooxygenase YgiN
MRFLLSTLSLLLLSAGFTASAQEQRLYVVTYVDLTPNFADDGAKLLPKYAADCRKEKGIVRFEAFIDVGRKNHFTMVGVWENRAAFDAHLEADHTKQFRDKVQPMLGSPMDERLYSMLP